jgi:hypothetical protein
MEASGVLPSPLGLRQLFPKDVRRLLWRTYLNEYDRLMVWKAHGVTPPLHPGRAFVYHCAEHGYLALLQHFEAWTQPTELISVTEIAARRGYLSILEWAVSKSCIVSECVFLAAQYGHEHILDWLRPRVPNWNDDCWTGAAAGGHLHIMKQCQPLDLAVFLRSDVMYAAEGGHLHVIQWMVAQGYVELEKFNVMYYALNGGHVPLVSWLHEYLGVHHSPLACATAALAGHLELLQWLRGNGYPWWQTHPDQRQFAQHPEDNAAFRWAYAHGAPPYFRRVTY